MVQKEDKGDYIGQWNSTLGSVGSQFNNTVTTLTAWGGKSIHLPTVQQQWCMQATEEYQISAYKWCFECQWVGRTGRMYKVKTAVNESEGKGRKHIYTFLSCPSSHCNYCWDAETQTMSMNCFFLVLSAGILSKDSTTGLLIPTYVSKHV